MSKKQFVEFRDAGFWAHDVALGIFLKHLIDAAGYLAADSTESWLVETVANWRTVACISDFGLTLDAAWSREQITLFERLCSEATSRIRARDSFSPAELQGWNVLDGKGISPRVPAEIRAAPIVELGEAIIALVNGALPQPPPGTSWLLGAPEGRATLPLASPSKA